MCVNFLHLNKDMQHIAFNTNTCRYIQPLAFSALNNHNQEHIFYIVHQIININTTTSTEAYTLNYKIFYFMFIISLSLMCISCKDNEAEKKIGANLKFKIKQLYDSSKNDQILNVVLKSNETLTDFHKKVLQNKGVKILANIGNIYTASLPARLVYELAGMKFVDSIQSSKEVRTNSKDSVGVIQKF